MGSKAEDGKEAARERKIKRLTIATVGDAGVGKTCLIKRYCEERFVSKYLPTIGVDYGVRSVGVSGYENEVRVNFWDFSGAAEYDAVRKEVTKDCPPHGALVVFDVAIRSTFDHVKKWCEQVRSRTAGIEVVLLIVGNKADKVGSSQQETVRAGEAKRVAEELKAQYVEASASTGKNVMTCFDDLFLRVARKCL